MNKQKKQVAVILLNYNGSDDTVECIESLYNQKGYNSFQIFILDNGSNEENRLKLEGFCKKRDDFKIVNYEEFLSFGDDLNILLLSDKNYGFAKGNNNVIRLVMDRFNYVLLLNNDTIVEPTFLNEMMSFIKDNPEIKYSSCRINNFYNRDLLWNCGGEVKWWGNKHYFTEKELSRKGDVVKTSFISGCALFLETNMLRKQGLLSEDFFHGEEDFNFCWRMKKAKVLGCCLKKVLVYHKVSVSSKRTGCKVGKVAGYYVNRIIDMHKFSPYGDKFLNL